MLRETPPIAPSEPRRRRGGSRIGRLPVDRLSPTPRATTSRSTRTTTRSTAATGCSPAQPTCRLRPSPGTRPWRRARAPIGGACVGSTLGSVGQWSAFGRFFVTGGTPNIVGPAPGAPQAPDGPVLEWEPLGGAASYTVTITPSGGGSAVIANTVASAWAATTKFATGMYNWTLVAKDASGNNWGARPHVRRGRGQLVADGAPQILAPAGPESEAPSTVNPPTWWAGTPTCR